MGLCNKVVLSWKNVFWNQTDIFAESSYPLQGHGTSAKVKAMHNSILDPNYGLIYQINDKNVLNLWNQSLHSTWSEGEKEMAKNFPNGKKCSKITHFRDICIKERVSFSGTFLHLCPTTHFPLGSTCASDAKYDLSLVHSLMHLSNACLHDKSLHSYLTLCGPMDCSLPRSSVRGMLQTRTLEWA